MTGLQQQVPFLLMVLNPAGQGRLLGGCCFPLLLYDAEKAAANVSIVWVTAGANENPSEPGRSSILLTQAEWGKQL